MTPDVPLRLDLSFEMPGTPEQVWQAIATENGLSAWFLPTDFEEGEGGHVYFHMGPDDGSPGTITGWEPPHRVAYEEPEWASLSGHDPDSVTPLATEFLVEAQSGGTCVVRVVSSAFGTGADWEQEFFTEMEKGWTPWFETLRLYLTRFPGQQVSVLSATSEIPGEQDAVWGALCRSLGAEGTGSAVDAIGLTGSVERFADDPRALLLSVTEPMPGYATFFVYQSGEESTTVGAEGRFFTEEAPGFVEREQTAWEAWLNGLAADVA